MLALKADTNVKTKSSLVLLKKWRCTPAMLAVRRPKQKDHAKFKASLGYTARLSLRKPKQ